MSPGPAPDDSGAPAPRRLVLVGPGDGARGARAGADGETGDFAALFRPLEALGVELVTTRSLVAARDEASAAATLRNPSGLDVLALNPAAAEAHARRLHEAPHPRGASPVLIVAEQGDPIAPVVAGRALREAVPWDIVRRDATPEEILVRMEHLLAQARTRADLERARYEATHDDRTGLLRPAPFDQRLREHVSAAQRHGLDLALVLIDLDRFGDVNKRYDHTVGDQIIARAGSVIRMTLREEDVAARLGGDEFAIILPFTQRVDAARVVSRLAGRFRALSGPPPAAFRSSGATPSIRVSASLGFETYDGADLQSAEDLRAHAEQALLAAKSRGGDQGVYFRSLGADAG